jgi:hypothetical protein
VAEGNPENEPTIVERWLEDQQQWQRTVLAYLDSMTKNDDFLVHLGNAMRGSLLAGKPYPTAPISASAPAATAPEAAPNEQAAPREQAAPDDRLDKVLHALHQLEGQIQDLQMTLEEIREGRARSAAATVPVRKKRAPAARKTSGRKPAVRAAAVRPASKSKKRKGRS